MNSKNTDKLIFIVRHGETNNNLTDVFQDINDDPNINELGKEQARKTGQYFKKFHKDDISYVFHSEKKRTKKTAELITKQLNIQNKKFIETSLINECNYGGITGKTMGEVSKMMDDIEQQIIDPSKKDDFVYKRLLKRQVRDEFDKIYKVESLNNIYFRATQFLSEIRKLKGNVLVVSHQSFIKYLIQAQFNIQDVVEKYPNGKNCSITVIQQQGNKFSLLCPTTTEHLSIAY